MAALQSGSGRAVFYADTPLLPLVSYYGPSNDTQRNALFLNTLSYILPSEPDIAMQDATEASATSVTVNYAINNADVSQPLQFNVYQSATPPPTSSPFVPGLTDALVGSTILPASDTADLAMGQHHLTLSLSNPLQSDLVIPT